LRNKNNWILPWMHNSNANNFIRIPCKNPINIHSIHVSSNNFKCKKYSRFKWNCRRIFNYWHILNQNLSITEHYVIVNMKQNKIFFKIIMKNFSFLFNNFVIGFCLFIFYIYFSILSCLFLRKDVLKKY